MSDSFLAITHQRYSSMNKRFGKLPFTLFRFREFIENLLGGEQGLTRCEYCHTPLDLLRLQLDHRLPPYSQGGSLDLDNLAPACEPCNAQKGQMSGQAFTALLMLVNGDERLQKLGIPRFSSVDRADLLGRLQSQLKLAKRELARRRQLYRESKVSIQPHQRRSA